MRQYFILLGYVEEYDESVEEIKSINRELTQYLESQRKLLSSSKVMKVKGTLNMETISIAKYQQVT